MTEVWRDIPGFEGLYQASSMGRIKSLSRYKRIGHGGMQPIPERILSASVGNRVGHLKVALSKGGVKEKWFVHRAVMEAFVGRRPDGSEVRHLNGDPADNHIENLVYGTSHENHIDQSRMMRMSNQKINPKDVPVIRKRLAGGETCQSIARDYGVSFYTIFDIKKRRTFAWVSALDECRGQGIETMTPAELESLTERCGK